MENNISCNHTSYLHCKCKSESNIQFAPHLSLHKTLSIFMFSVQCSLLCICTLGLCVTLLIHIRHKWSNVWPVFGITPFVHFSSWMDDSFFMSHARSAHAHFTRTRTCMCMRAWVSPTLRCIFSHYITASKNVLRNISRIFQSVCYFLLVRHITKHSNRCKLRKLLSKLSRVWVKLVECVHVWTVHTLRRRGVERNI